MQSSKLMELKDGAWEMLGKPFMQPRGRGSLEHRTYANCLALLGRKHGHEAIVECLAPATTHPVDCAWKLDANTWEVFEVVVQCEENITDHLQAIFLTPQSPVATATIVAPKKNMLDDLRVRVVECQSLAPFMDRIRFTPVSNVEEELWPA